MSNNLKHFQLSCPVFWGFNRMLDITGVKSIQDCVNLVLDVHEQFLFENNYIDLLNFFKSVRKDYHIHDSQFENILVTKETIYVCRHNSNQNNFLN
jgi:hypothetical protein